LQQIRCKNEKPRNRGAFSRQLKAGCSAQDTSEIIQRAFAAIAANLVSFARD